MSFSRSAVRILTRRVSLPETNSNTLEQLRQSRSGQLTRDQNIAELVEIIQVETDEVRNSVGERRRITVDEFQDMPDVRGELVLSLLGLMAPKRSTGCGFTILGDPAHAIYGFAANAMDAGASASSYWRRATQSYGSELHIRSSGGTTE